MTPKLDSTLLQQLRRHAGNFLRDLTNGHYERSPHGLFFPRSGRFHIGGIISAHIDDGRLLLAHNTATQEGLNDILSVYMKQGAQRTGFYFVPYSNNVVPDDTVTAANFNATLSEFTNYTAGQRQQWTGGAVANQSVDNSAALAQLVIGAGGGSVRGAGLSSIPNKSAATGVVPFVAPFDDGMATLSAGSKLNLEYTLGATSE